MNALWHRRPVRHVVAGLLLLLVLGAALLVLLGVRYAAAAAPLRDATARTVATVAESGLGDDGRGVKLSWTDEQQVSRTGTVRASGPGRSPAGAKVQIRYVPSDPARVYAAGDENAARLRDIGFGLVSVGFVLVVAVVVSIAHVLRRLAAERRPGTAMQVSYARTRRRLWRRSWLVLTDQSQQWWVPVHWEPVLGRLRREATATVHGRPGRDRVLAVEVDGNVVWQAAGRPRTAPPRGEISASEEDVWSPPPAATQPAATQPAATQPDATQPDATQPAAAKPDAVERATTDPTTTDPTATDPTATEPGATQPAAAKDAGAEVSVAHHLRADGALLVAAPLIGLAWAYIDGTGRGGALVATVLVAAVLVWLPTILGSDPT